MKALEKLYSIMPIKCSFDPLFDRQQLKNTRKLHFRWLFYWESVSTPNVIASWVLVWTLVLRFIFKYCRGGRGSHPTEIYLEIKYLVLWHIKLNPLRNYSYIPIKCSFHASFNHLQQKLLGKSLFYNCTYSLLLLFLLLAIKYFLNMRKVGSRYLITCQID